MPQLYWPIEQAAQSYPVLLDYWAKENVRGRHLWPGLFTSRIEKDSTAKSWKTDEIVNQIQLTRQRASTDAMLQGHVHFSMVALMDNRQGLNDRLKSLYDMPALSPAMPWLNDNAPAPPLPRVSRLPGARRALALVVQAGSADAVWQYAVWTRHGERWNFTTLPAIAASGYDARTGSVRLAELGIADSAAGAADAINAIVVSAVDRAGNESRRVRLLLGADGFREEP